MPQSASRLHFISALCCYCLWITLWSSRKIAKNLQAANLAF